MNKLEAFEIIRNNIFNLSIQALEALKTKRKALNKPCPYDPDGLLLYLTEVSVAHEWMEDCLREFDRMAYILNRRNSVINMRPIHDLTELIVETYKGRVITKRDKYGNTGCIIENKNVLDFRKYNEFLRRKRFKIVGGEEEIGDLTPDMHGPLKREYLRTHRFPHDFDFDENLFGRLGEVYEPRFQT